MSYPKLEFRTARTSRIFGFFFRSLCVSNLLETCVGEFCQCKLCCWEEQDNPHKETLTIPKLELIAACLSVRLVQIVLKELKLVECFVFYWADAACVSHLISSDEKRYKILWLTDCLLFGSMHHPADGIFVRLL